MSDISSHTTVEMGSEKSFGIVFGAVFLIFALWPLVFHGAPVRYWALMIAAVFFVLSFAAPQILKPLNLLWFKFGMLLSKIMAPLAMGIIFFLTITPIGLVRRMKNRDPLNQRFVSDAESYWIKRDQEIDKQTSMRKQF